MAMGRVFFGIIFYILCQNAVESEWNSNDYLKREFSLVKPYSGIINAAFHVKFSVSGVTEVTTDHN